MSSNNYDKRHFIESASVAFMIARLRASTVTNAKDCVSLAHEMWDELEAQVPLEEKKTDG